MKLTRIRFALAVLAGLAVAGVGLYASGLRAEFDGTGIWPIFKWERKGAHYAEIEKRAAEDRAAIAVEPAPVAATLTPDPQAAVAAKPVTAAQKQESEPAALAPWPAFYGPKRDGHYDETPILTAWPAAGLKRVWKRPVGGGYASMIVASGQIFTIEQRREKEALVAYDLATGREAWAVDWPAFFQESMGGDGPRATPTYDDGRVYVLGATGEFRCVDAGSGKTIWRKNILDDNGATNLQWGMAAAPLVVDDKVIVLPGGSGGKSVVAYNKLTGARIWNALDDKAAYAAPMLVTLAGVRQIVAMTASRVVGLSVSEGKLLWETPWTTQYNVNSAMPIVVGDDRLILTSGYGTGAKLVEISKQDEALAAKDLWLSQAMKCKFNNAVVSGGVIYGLDEGILAAMDVATGKRLWKGGRYGYGQLLLAQGHLVVISEQGELALVKASPKGFEEVAKFEALEGKTWNVPAMAGGNLLVRNTTEMACFRIGI